MSTYQSIVFICPNYPKRGGVEAVTGFLTDFFIKHGYDVTLLVSKKQLKETNTLDRHDHRMIEMPGILNSVENLNFLDVYFRHKPHTVIINQGLQSLIYQQYKPLPTQLFINTLHGKPFWELDLFHFYSLKDLLKNAPSSFSKSILFLRYVFAKIHSEWAFPRLSYFYKQQIEHVHHYVVLDDSFRKTLEERLYKGFRKSTIKVIQNPLPYSAVDPCKKSQMVLYVGRLIRSSKRVDRLLKIWKRLEKNQPDWNLVIIGDGEDRTALQKLCFDLNLQHVSFKGIQDAEPYYEKASILCLTSSWEGTPMVIPEAQHFGVVPIVYECVTSMQTMIDHEINGILIPPYDENAFTLALGSLMNHPEKLKMMSENGPAKTTDLMLDKIGNQWIELFEGPKE